LGLAGIEEFWLDGMDALARLREDRTSLDAFRFSEAGSVEQRVKEGFSGEKWLWSVAEETLLPEGCSSGVGFSSL